MFRSFRLALVALLATLMAVGPAGAYCGCSAPESEPVEYESSCADCGAAYESSPCEGAACEGTGCEAGDCGCAGCEGSAYEAAPIEASTGCGCEAAVEESTMHDPEPVEAKPQEVPITPVVPTDPAPAVSDPLPAEAPAVQPPVSTEKPIPPPTTPAVEPAEEMFDAPPATTPAEPPVEETPAASEPPAETPATDTTDDLFSSPPAESTPPAETTPPSAEPAADTPTEEPKEEETPPAEKEDDPLEDFFNSVPRASALQVAGGLESELHRTWIDNTGKFRCEARLMSVTQHDIVLAKSNGTLKTVPLQRLSNTDLRFVHDQVVAKREVLARQSTGDKLAGR